MTSNTHFRKLRYSIEYIKAGTAHFAHSRAWWLDSLPTQRQWQGPQNHMLHTGRTCPLRVYAGCFPALTTKEANQLDKKPALPHYKAGGQLGSVPNESAITARARHIWPFSDKAKDSLACPFQHKQLRSFPDENTPPNTIRSLRCRRRPL